MATDPNILLAANIFGNSQPNMQDPRIRALFGLPPLPQQPVPLIVHQPVPVPVPVKAGAKPSGKLLPNTTDNPFAFYSAPQDMNEPDIAYGIRHAVGAPFRAIQHGVEDVSQGIREGFQTPASRAAAQQQGGGGGRGSNAGGSAFPTSYNDPAYSAADENASRITGVPAVLISAIRQRGERTNAGVVSKAGANTPYQITPGTRQGIIKNYGIDPWSSPENAALGAAYVLREQAGKPGPKDWNNALALRAVGGYFGGAAGAANPNSTLADANGQTVAGYTQQVLNGKTPLAAPFLNAYDPSYDQAAGGMIDRERQALLTPFSATVNTGKMPEMPAPEALPKTDYTATDEALKAMEPVAMSEKEKMQRERNGFFTGIAQAMMHSSGNEGIGTFLMHIGGGALGGRMQARDDIQREQDKFDDKMSQYKALVYRNELGKADTVHQEAVAQVAQNNSYNMNKWQIAYNNWTKNSTIDIAGTNAVISQRDPEKGTMTVRTVPIQGAVDAAIAHQGAELFQSMGGRQMAGNETIAAMQNSLIGRQAIETMMNKGGTAEADGAAAAAPAFYGTYIATHGLVGDLLGPDGAKSLEADTMKSLTSQGLAPGTKEYIDKHDTYVATQLAKLALAKPEIMQKMMQVGGTAGSFSANDAIESQKTRTSTDYRGRTTTTSTGSVDAATLFDNSADNQYSNQNLNKNYGYSRY